MSDLLDVMGLVSGAMPQAPDASADTELTTVGVVYDVNAAARLVKVGVHDAPLWLHAMPGRYQVRVVGSAVAGSTSPGLARVLLNATTGRAELVLGPVNPRDPEVPGTLTAIDTTAKRATVSVEGASHVLPYKPSTYAVGADVWVGLSDWGVPYLVQGPSDVAAVASTPPSAPSAPGSAQTTQTIGPQWSGTWRSTRAAWDRWNTDRYGGRSTLYQGDAFGSGPLKGLATYGDQLVNLGAVSIDRVQVMLRGVGLSGAAGPATVQGSPHGSQPGGAPTSSGDTAAGDGWVDLPASVREAMRTGAVKGLCTVGANYWAVAGAGNGDGMVLAVTYTRSV